MPIRITLRTSLAVSPFKRELTRLIEDPAGDTLLICSGFIWEPDITSTQYKVLDDILPSITKGCISGKVITIAGKLDNQQWIDHYANFIRRIRAAGLTVDAYVAPQKNWHAKIAIKLKDKTPVAGIVGSSNLTGPAIRENGYSWNFEGDVLIWPLDPMATKYYRYDDTSLGENISMELAMDSSVKQPDETQRLNDIYHDVMSANLSVFQV